MNMFRRGKTRGFPGLGDYNTLDEFGRACEDFIAMQEERVACWDDVRVLAEKRGLRFSSGSGEESGQEQIWVGRPLGGNPKAFASQTCIVLASDPDGPAKLIAWIEEKYPLPIIPDRIRTVRQVYPHELREHGLIPLSPPYSRRRGLRGLIDRLFYR